MFEYESEMAPVCTLEPGDIIEFDTAIETKVKGIVLHTAYKRIDDRYTITMAEGFSPRNIKDSFQYRLLSNKEVTLIGQILYSALGLTSDNY